MRILLLGSNGFIGKLLGVYLDGFHEVTKVDRSTNSEKLFKSGESFDFVVNCVSSKPTANSIESRESNFEYPIRFLKEVISKHWIQIESYFQLQIPMGRRDPYTLDKQSFCEYLDENSKTQILPSIHHLYMPHVFGEGERAGRVISSAKFSFIRGESFKTSSGSQYLPLLHVSDAVLGISQFIENPTGVAACPPFWYGQVKDLLGLMALQFQEARLLYGLRPDPIDAHFPPVEFPKPIDGWQPKVQMDEFLGWVKVQSV